MLRFDKVVLAQDAFRLTVDWELPAGARVAVIGPSGAGKSTLLSAVAGFFAPQSGRVLWQGQDLAPLEPGARPVTILFQDQNLKFLSLSRGGRYHNFYRLLYRMHNNQIAVFNTFCAVFCEIIQINIQTALKIFNYLN